MDDEPEVTIPEDDPEGRHRQEALTAAILAGAGVEFVEELTHPTEAEQEVEEL